MIQILDSIELEETNRALKDMLNEGSFTLVVTIPT